MAIGQERTCQNHEPVSIIDIAILLTDIVNVGEDENANTFSRLIRIIEWTEVKPVPSLARRGKTGYYSELLDESE